MEWSVTRGGLDWLIHSTDGIHWTAIGSAYSPSPFSLNGSASIVDTGKTVYACNAGQATPPSADGYYTAPLGTQGPLTVAPSTPTLEGGAYMAYDPVNNIVYSSNLTGGFWRLALP